MVMIDRRSVATKLRRTGGVLVCVLLLLVLAALVLPPTSEAAATGTLRLDTSPNTVEIHINGEYSGQTSYGSATVGGILPGTYTLVLTRDGYGTWSKQVTIAAGKQTRVYAYLEPGVANTPTRSETITEAATYGSLRLDTLPPPSKYT